MTPKNQERVQFLWELSIVLVAYPVMIGVAVGKALFGCNADNR